MLNPFTMPTTKMSSGPCSSFCRPLGIKPGHAGLTHALQQCQAKSHRQSHRQFQAAAASDIVAVLQPSLDVIPYTSSSAPKLKSRSMVGSPLDGLWHAVSSAALQAELLSAAYIDKHNPMGPAVISVLAGSAAAMGLDAFTLLSSYGLPPNIQDMLLAAFGAWDTTVYWVAALLLSVPLTAWAVRAWWATNMQLLSSPVAQLLQQITQQRSSQGQQQQAANSNSRFLTGVAIVARALLLGSVATNFIKAVAVASITSPVVPLVKAVAAAALAAAALALPLLLPKRDTITASSFAAGSNKGSDSSSSGKPAGVVAGGLLGLEAAWVIAMLGFGPLLNTVCAAALTACTFTLHQSVVVPRLAACKAAVGDAVEAQIAVKLEGTAVAFDSTLPEGPLHMTATRITPEQQQHWQMQYWQQQLFGGDAETSNSKQQQETIASAAGSQVSAHSGAEGVTSSSSNEADETLAQVSNEVHAWLSKPATRWEVLQPLIADAAAGMYLGESKTVTIFNPSGSGYWNPKFTWWQPTTDVVQKFRGQMPNVGDVFWYPVAERASVPTRVAMICEEFTELDANYGITDTQLQLEIKLVRLHKQ